VNRDKAFLLEKMYDDNIIASNSLTGNGEKAGPGPLLLKILVPAYAAGSIIGKSRLYTVKLLKNQALFYSCLQILKTHRSCLENRDLIVTAKLTK